MPAWARAYVRSAPRPLDRALAWLAEFAADPGAELRAGAGVAPRGDGGEGLTAFVSGARAVA